MNAVKRYLILVPVLLFCLVSREFLLRPFWFDESLTLMNFALLSPDKIYSSYFIPNNHIGYTILLHIWYGIMPQTAAPDVWCRLISFGMGIAFILFSWSKFKNFVFRTALSCLAVSMPFVIYATSVRGYMAALLFSMTTVYCSCCFARAGTVKNAVLLFLSALCCVSVLPSNLFVLAAAFIYAVPLFGKKFYRQRNFYLAGIILLAAFLIFWLPLYSLLVKASQLGEGWYDAWHSLGAGVISFVSCIALVVLAALFGFRKKLRVKDIRLLVFFTVLPLVFCAKAAPFPRVYFPFFGVFMLVASNYGSRSLAWLRKKRFFSYSKIKLFFFALALGTTLLLNYSGISLDFLSECNGGVTQDDYFKPWYIAKSHVPDETAKFLAGNKGNFHYLSFSSDPWSVMFYSALNGLNIRSFYFDGPQGRVEQLPYDAVVVINKNESVNGLVERFGGRFELISTNPMHKIYLHRF